MQTKTSFLFICLAFLLMPTKYVTAQAQPDSLIDLARDFMLLSDYQEAIIQLDRILEKEETHPQAAALKAEILLLQNEERAAGKLVAKALKVHPQEAALIYVDGKLDLNRGRLERATEQFTRALVLATGNNALQNDIYLNRGAAYQKLLDTELALDDYSKAVALNPNNPNVYIYRGTLHFTNENYALAIEDFEKVILIDPNNPFAYYNLGMAYLKLDDSGKACKNFHKGCELGNKNACRMVIMNCIELKNRK